MSKKKQSKALTTFNRVLLSNNIEPIKKESITDVLLELHILYDRLVDKKLTDEQYILFNKLLVGAFYLAAQLNEHGSPKMQEFTQQFHGDVQAAALAISEVGCAKKENKADTYVATERELKVIYFGIALYEFFLGRATEGHFLTANTKAAALIAGKLMQLGKTTRP